jgi:hypothetical protein
MVLAEAEIPKTLGLNRENGVRVQQVGTHDRVKREITAMEYSADLPVLTSRSATLPSYIIQHELVQSSCAHSEPGLWKSV